MGRTGYWLAGILILIVLLSFPDVGKSVVNVVGSTRFTNYSASRQAEITDRITTARFQTYSANHASVGGSATWGGITGTLSGQTDLQSALDAKKAIAAFDSYSTAAHSKYAPFANPTFTGKVTSPIAIAGVMTHSATHTSTTPVTLTGKIIEVSTDNDGDADYLYLPAGVAGQELEIVIKSMGATCTGLGVYATFADGSTNYTFPAGSTGKGMNLVYSANSTSGWVITAIYALSASNPAALGTAAPGTSNIPAREDHVHATGSGIGAIYRVATSDFTTSSTTAGNVTGLTWSISASAVQTFHCLLNTTNTATSLLRFNVNGPASPTAVSVAYSYRSTAYGTEVINAAGAFSATATTAAVTTSVLTTPIVFSIYGTIKNGANAGTVAVMATASTSGQTGTIRTGSSCFVY